MGGVFVEPPICISKFLAVGISISAWISTVFVFHVSRKTSLFFNGNFIPAILTVSLLLSKRMLWNLTALPRSLLNCGAGFCRSWPSRDKLNRRGRERQPFQPC